MKRLMTILLPVLVIALAVAVAYFFYLNKPDVEKQVPDFLPPLVRVLTVEFTDLQYTVKSQGTVTPRTESQLVPEVSGRVIEVSPQFASGGFFEAGDILVRIDPHDYRQAVIRARAEVARTNLMLERERAEADLARREWEELGRGEATPLTLHVPQLENARASLAAAGAALETAERNLERADVPAPYAGRIRKKMVDIGQFVTVGTPLATLYSVDYAEIRLPLPDDQLAYIDLPLSYRGENSPSDGPEVTLHSNFAGLDNEWSGRIVRTEGEIDPHSRMVHAVARVKDPYGRQSGTGKLPLSAGMFVSAEIRGRHVKDAVVLPRAALRSEDTVYVVEKDERLVFRQVEVLRVTNRDVVIGSGLSPGEQVCMSPLEAVTDGMKVRTDETGRDREAAIDGEESPA